MKKLLIIVLSMLFVAGAFTAVYADDAGMDSVRATVPGSKIILGGDAYVSGIWNKNYNLDSDLDTDDRYWDQRVRLNVTAKLGEGVEVRTRTVMSDGKWGTSDSAANIGDTNGALTIDYAYLHIPVNDITMDIGRQKVSFGNALYIMGQTRDRLKVTTKMQDAVVGLFVDKLVETDIAGDDNLDDMDDFGVFATQKFGDFEAGGMFVYHNDDSPTNAKGQIIDVFANGKVGDIGVAAEFAYKTGDAYYETADEDAQWATFVMASKALNDTTVSAAVVYTKNGYVADNHFTPTLFFGTDQDTAIMDLGDNGDTLAAVLSTDYKAAPDLSVVGRLAYASFSEYKTGDYVDASCIEIDAGLTYALAKNTTYSVDFGYLMPTDMSPTDDAAIAVAHTVSIAF